MIPITTDNPDLHCFLLANMLHLAGWHEVPNKASRDIYGYLYVTWNIRTSRAQTSLGIHAESMARDAGRRGRQSAVNHIRVIVPCLPLSVAWRPDTNHNLEAS